jgi:hypothetical protein
MTIKDNPTRNQYEATGGQTVFNYNFEIFASGDIVVYQDDTLLSLTTHYTLTGVGDEDGGTVVLVTGATAGDVLTIYRDTAAERLTDYQNSGDFLAAEVNSDFDRLWALIQEISTNSTLYFQFDSTTTATLPITIEDPSSGLALRWNVTATGLENYDPSTLTNEAVLADKVVINYQTLNAAVIDTSLKVNQLCRVQERTVNGDGGGYWLAVLLASVTPDTEKIVACTGNTDLALVLLDVEDVHIADTSASLAGMDLIPGQTAITQGDVTVGDDMGRSYRIVAPQAVGANDKLLTNGNVAVWRKSFYYNSGTDLTSTNVEDAITESANNFEVFSSQTDTFTTNFPSYMRGVSSDNQGRPYPYDVPDGTDDIVAIKTDATIGDERWLIRTKFTGWKQGDYAEYEMWNQGNTMAPKMTFCWALNGVRLYKSGNLYNFSNLNGLTPSTVEFAMRIGLMTDTDITDIALWDFYGPGHGFMQYVAGQIFLDGGAPDETGAALGTVLRGATISFQSQAGTVLPRDFKITTVITNITQANPAVVTSVAHGLITGDQVHLRNVVGMTEVNDNTYTITVSDVDNFSLNGINSTGFGAYTSGGSVAKVTVTGTVNWQHGYDSAGLRLGHQHNITLAGVGNQNSYMGMGPMTHIDTVDPVNGDPITVGAEDGSQVGNWSSPDTGTKLQHYYAHEPTTYFEMNLAQGHVGSPPGDWSDATTSRRFVQDRTEGVRKSYFNWRSGTAAQSVSGAHTHLMDYKFYTS